MKNNRLYKYMWHFYNDWEYRLTIHVQTHPLFNLMDINVINNFIIATIPRIESKWEFNAFKNLFKKYGLNIDNYIFRCENGYFYNKDEILFMYKIIYDYIFKYRLNNGYKGSDEK